MTYPVQAFDLNFKNEASVRMLLIILGIWLLLNILFVLAMEPPRKAKKPIAPGSSPAKFAPATIDKKAHQHDLEEEASISMIIVSVARGAFFVLVPPITVGPQGRHEKSFANETPAQQARHAEIAKRHRRKKRRSGKPTLFANRRMAEVERLYLDRWGSNILPDDDAGRSDLCLWADHAAQRGAHYLAGRARVLAPWLTEGELDGEIKRRAGKVLDVWRTGVCPLGESPWRM